MKNIILLSFLCTLSIPKLLNAEDIKLPVISKPNILDEGTQTVLSQAMIDELLPWAKDSKAFLNDLLENIQGLNTEDKVDRLVDGIKQIVGESSAKNSELLMRYALNRGLAVYGLLSRETIKDSVGSADSKLRVLRASINLALKYYDTDMAILLKKTTAPFVLFGLDYFNFLSDLNKSVFDASAQYAIQRTALEWLQWDLYRDLNNLAYAPQIVKINSSLKMFPSNSALTDAQAIAIIRQMKKVGQQLNVKETLEKLERERRLSLMSEEERKAEIEAANLLIRSAFDQELVRANIISITSSSWVTRKEAVKTLKEVPGNDITMTFLDRLYNESDSDVYSLLRSALINRCSNETSKYLLKNESKETLDTNLIQYITRWGRPGSWVTRRDLAKLLGYVKTIESYRLLSSWLIIEEYSDVKSETVSSMKKIESANRK